MAIQKEKLVLFFDAVAFWACCVLVFFIPISTAAIEIAFGVLLGAFLFVCIIDRSVAWQRARLVFGRTENRCVLIFLCALALSLIMSGEYLGKSIDALICKWGEYIALFLLAQFFLSKEKIKCVVAVYIIGSVLVIINGLYQRIVGVDFLRGFTLVRPPGAGYSMKFITSSMNHFNAYGVYLVSIILLLLSQWKTYGAKHRMGKYAKVLLLLAAAVSLFFTLSRGSWLSLAVIVCILSFTLLSIKLKVGLVILFLSGGVLCYVHPLLHDAIFLRGNSGRMGLWQWGIDMWQTSPLLGTGLNTCMAYFSKTLPAEVQYLHNSYLQLMMETGIIGLLSFMIFLFFLVGKNIRTVITKKDGLAVGLLALLCAFLFHAFFDNHFFMLHLSMLFWFYAGCYVVVKYEDI